MGAVAPEALTLTLSRQAGEGNQPLQSITPV